MSLSDSQNVEGTFIDVTIVGPIKDDSAFCICKQKHKLTCVIGVCGSS